MGKAVKSVLKPIKRLGKSALSAVGLEAPKIPGAVEAPTPAAAAEQPVGEVTDNTAEALANARQQALRLKSRRGRSSLRIDLATPATGSGSTRSGISIN